MAQEPSTSNATWGEYFASDNPTHDVQCHCTPYVDGEPMPAVASLCKRRPSGRKVYQSQIDADVDRPADVSSEGVSTRDAFMLERLANWAGTNPTHVVQCRCAPSVDGVINRSKAHLCADERPRQIYRSQLARLAGDLGYVDSNNKFVRTLTEEDVTKGLAWVPLAELSLPQENLVVNERVVQTLADEGIETIQENGMVIFRNVGPDLLKQKHVIAALKASPSNVPNVSYVSRTVEFEPDLVANLARKGVRFRDNGDVVTFLLPVSLEFENVANALRNTPKATLRYSADQVKPSKTFKSALADHAVEMNKDSNGTIVITPA